MTIESTSDVYYDPYDAAIDADPYPVFRRLREEAPLYYNETHDFYAVSRFDDVERGLLDNKTFISGRGGIIELIRANIEMPSGVLIFEDPPVHTIHRRLMSRVFSANRVAALEPQIREFCAHSLDPLVGSGGFDFIADLGAQMPMRVIGMLLGIPEQDQEAVRDRVDANLRTEAGQPMEVSEDFVPTDMFGEYIDWRADHPSDDIMTDLLQAEFEDETGTVRRPDPRRAADLHQRHHRGRQRDHRPAHRMDRQGPGRPSGPATGAGRGPVAHPGRHRRAPALRDARPPHVPLRRRATSSSTARPSPRGAS